MYQHHHNAQKGYPLKFYCQYIQEIIELFRNSQLIMILKKSVSNLMPTLFKVSKMIKDNHNFDFFHHIIVTDGLILYHLIRIWSDNLIVKEMVLIN